MFIWFAGIGALTVVMSGGISRRRTPRPVPAAAPAPPPVEDTAPIPAAQEAPVEEPEIVAEIVDDDPVFEETGFEEPDYEPAFEEPAASASVRAPARDLFDIDDDPEAHYFTDDDVASDDPRRSAD